MKKILYILTLVLVSCNTSKYAINVAAGTDASEPGKGNFIKMKSGREVKLSENIDILSGTPELDRTKNIKIGDKKYKGKDIASFQLNGDYYSNTAKDVFARRIYRGPINVFKNTSTSTTSSYSGSRGFGSTNGGWSTTTTSSNNYYVQSPTIAKGALTRVNLTGRNRGLDVYLKDYKPSMDILAKYRQQRKVSRIVKFSAAGLLLASIPVIVAAPEGSVLQTIGAATFTASFISIIPLSVFYKHRNHARPMEAVQKYIDNIVVPDAPVAQSPAPVTQENVADPVSVVKPDHALTVDFIELNNNKVIVAAEGTKVKSANNKIFMVNGEKYTSGITAFQISKKYYKHFPDMAEPADFAQRSVNGKISAYNVVNGSQNTQAITSRNMFVGKKNTYFMKDGVDGFIKKRQQLAPYFQDNSNAFAVYSGYTQHYKKFKTTYFILTGVTVAAFVGTLVSGLSSSKIGGAFYGFAGAGMAAGIGNYFYVKNTVPKLNKEFMEALNIYNGSKNPKQTKKVLAKKDK